MFYPFSCYILLIQYYFSQGSSSLTSVLIFLVKLTNLVGGLIKGLIRFSSKNVKIWLIC